MTPRRLLVINNPGRVSRFYMDGIIRAAVDHGIEVRVFELEQIYRLQPDPLALANVFKETVERWNIGAVVSYGFNGAADLPAMPADDGRLMPLFEALSVKHLMMWTDHPHWFMGRAPLQPGVQELMRSANHVHLLKSGCAARELEEFFGWRNCHTLHVGADPQLIRPLSDVEPDFDVVCISTSKPGLPPGVEPFLADDEPDADAIRCVVAGNTRTQMQELWRIRAPTGLHPQLEKFGEDWIECRCHHPETGVVHLFERLEPAHIDACRWLRDNPLIYIDAARCLFALGGWMRQFLPVYLSRWFRVGVFGSDWSSAGVGGSGEWVDYAEQSAIYARGRIALNVTAGHDEEGLTHKPFQIAASGVPMVHDDRVGLGECFEIGTEVVSYSSPAEARHVIEELLRDPQRRVAMANAARARLERDHTWSRWLERAFVCAGLELEVFRQRQTAG